MALSYMMLLNLDFTSLGLNQDTEDSVKSNSTFNKQLISLLFELPVEA